MRARSESVFALRATTALAIGWVWLSACSDSPPPLFNSNGSSLGGSGGAAVVGGTSSVGGTQSGGSATGGVAAAPGGLPTGGANTGGTNTGGDTASGGSSSEFGGTGGDTAAETGGTVGAGGSLPGAGGTGGSVGSAGASPGGAGNSCMPTTELCDGVDNDCDGSTLDEVCPKGCVGRAFEGHGYMFCDIYGGKGQAAESCALSGGRRLVAVESEEENAFLLSVSVELGWFGPWIGASDSESEGTWEWPDGTQFWQGAVNGNPVDGRFSNWAPNNPNDFDPGQDCAALCSQLQAVSCTDLGLWQDVECTNERTGFVCEGP